MTLRKPTEELEREHRVIQQVVGGMAMLIEKLESGKQVEAAVLTDLSEFMRTFGDRCHHGKEQHRAETARGMTRLPSPASSGIFL